MSECDRRQRCVQYHPHMPTPTLIDAKIFTLFFNRIMRGTGKLHNHPSGDPTPSRADIDMTKQIIETAKPLGIAVHDHIIIGRKGNASMKGLLLI